MESAVQSTTTNALANTEDTLPVRSPCPVLNALANQGIISSSGRNITLPELTAALKYLGVGPDQAFLLTHIAFQVHTDPEKPPPSTSLKDIILRKISVFGLRDQEDVNEQGEPVIHLDKVGRPQAVEHDISATRQDRALGDCITKDPDLVAQMLATPKNGVSFKSADLIQIRKTRYLQQKAANPELNFGKIQHTLACGELALIQAIFGKGWRYEIPKEYIEALFGEERLPIEEGWTPRKFPLLSPEAIVLTTYIERKSKIW